MAAEWFDSPCVVRQVIECSNMKRSLSALEPTIIAISVLLLKEIVVDLKDKMTAKCDIFLKFIDEFRSAIMNEETFSVNRDDFMSVWKNFW